jgi:hypothetical protein
LAGQDAQEANAGSGKAAGKRDQRDRLLAGGLPYNWPDTGPGARTRQGADVGRWVCEDDATLTPLLKDKVDARW